MNRTATLLTLAGGLALLAIVLGLPQKPNVVTTTSPDPTPIKVTVTPPPVDPPKPLLNQDGSLKMNAKLSHPFVVTGQSDMFVTVDVSGVELPGQERAPVNLALVIDRSGSMAGEKLTQAKQAARHLVHQLNDNDRLAIVHYGSDVKYLSSQFATAENKERMLRYIANIWDDGGTNISAGLNSGKAAIEAGKSDFKVNRIILISDGQPTEGMTSSKGLSRLASAIRSDGITVSSIGVGVDFNEDVMQRIAELGSGSYGFLRDASMLAAIFQKDLQQAGTTVARNVELSFELPANTTLKEVMGYSHSMSGRTVRVVLPDFSAGQLETIVARVQVDATATGAMDVTALKLNYQDLLANAPKLSSAQLSSMVTEKKEEMLANADKKVILMGARASSAMNVQKAAEAMKQGDFGGAQGYLQANDAIYDEAESYAGVGAASADRDQNSQYQQVITAAPTAAPEEQNYAAKKMKVDALRQSGRGASLY